MPASGKPFTDMFSSGKRLIEAQQFEEKIGKLYYRSHTPELLEDWKAARRLVARLAEEYLVAIRKWRESIFLKKA